MNCKHVDQLISSYIDGELRGADMIMVRNHINTCPECSEVAEQHRYVKMAIAGMADPIPDSGFEARLKNAVYESAKSSRKYSPRRKVALAFAGMSAVVAIVAIAQMSKPTSSVASQRSVPYEIARDQAYATGGDGLSGHFPIMPVSYDLK